ncbi:MAG: hypothetical protein WC859_01615 [Elusimicrobiota bacterium]|jgi:hypothetical protein
MDTLAHGLWGGAAFGQKDARQWRQAFVIGLAPDFFSFGLFFVTHLSDLQERWAHHHMGPPDPATIPPFVYHTYDITHSLVVWAAVVTAAYIFLAWRRRRSGFQTHPYSLQTLWPMGAWGLHILCDIPTHSMHFFPTPFFWPFPTPLVNGAPWGSGSFMLLNYTGLAVAYFLLLLRRRQKT